MSMTPILGGWATRAIHAGHDAGGTEMDYFGCNEATDDRRHARFDDQGRSLIDGDTVELN
jgi:hypothetical protein